MLLDFQDPFDVPVPLHNRHLVVLLSSNLCLFYVFIATKCTRFHLGFLSFPSPLGEVIQNWVLIDHCLDRTVFTQHLQASLEIATLNSMSGSPVL